MERSKSFGTLKHSLIKKAQEKYKTIAPCGGSNDLTECFTTFDNKLIFWFNLEDNSTRVLTAELTEK